MLPHKAVLLFTSYLSSSNLWLGGSRSERHDPADGGTREGASSQPVWGSARVKWTFRRSSLSL